jgi:signal transduction histidine kinase
MKDIHFDRSGTSEFNELNETLNLMSQKIYRDFLSMKEFTENAAHEMQTPIAVIQSKLEILLQEENLRHDQVRSVMEATESLSRLSKLNQGLLFLARIENNQYRADALVSFAEISRKYLSLFGEQIREKQLTVSADFTTDFCVRIHSLLADSLVSNLIGNAIKYNVAGGSIYINSGNLAYTISNTGNGSALPKNKIFSRFSGNGDAVSTGLGLAIVKQIAEANKLEISYRENNSVHFFSISKKASG